MGVTPFRLLMSSFMWSSLVMPEAHRSILASTTPSRRSISFVAGRIPSLDAAVRGRIACAWLKWREAPRILCDRRCSRVLKGKIYRTAVRPALIWGDEG
ncbi:hypothetical protein Y032_0071g511 [Ancylostoma ceylanicum]|uniref:Uncharacterized protein n=1 Tax=Ancylostoma ceylanicum TaxID=53326 RepID=A0A016TVX6_9BILA|nr:hypothetical protein Y032_0071g511 [Ancylostoma ceylanicum]